MREDNVAQAPVLILLTTFSAWSLISVYKRVRCVAKMQFTSVSGVCIEMQFMSVSGACIEMQFMSVSGACIEMQFVSVSGVWLKCSS